MNGEKRTTLRDVVASVISEGSDNESVTVTESYTALKYGNHGPTPSKILKLNRYQLHPKTYSPKWEQDPTYKGWVQRSKKGDGYYYCLACDQDYTCGKSELDKHASSKKHCMNLMNLPRKLGDVKANDNSSDDISKSDNYETESVFLTSQEFDASSTSAYDVLLYTMKIYFIFTLGI